MSVPSGRSVFLIIYGVLAVQGLVAEGSGFLLILSLQMELVAMIALYGIRPRRFIHRKDPAAGALLGGSVLLLLINYVVAVALGAALGEYPTNQPRSFLATPTATLAMPMLLLAFAHLLARVLDRIHYKNDAEYWSMLTSKLAITATLIALLGYLGMGLLFWFGEENKTYVVPCLVLLRFWLDYVLWPLPTEKPNKT